MGVFVCERAQRKQRGHRINLTSPYRPCTEMGVVASGSGVIQYSVNILMTLCRANNGSVNGKNVQRQQYELAVEHIL